MGYRVIVRRHSGTGNIHDAASTNPRCQDPGLEGYECYPAETWRDVRVLEYREGLKLVPCLVCNPIEGN